MVLGCELGHTEPRFLKQISSSYLKGLREMLDSHLWMA
ncbi:hypothetical protein [Pseudoalteromonas phage Pq0]|nr:hypothetical protein AXI74_gp14 [Pseudoalteromonas phage Pq0]AKN44297.1 hypothetical protein [Pseudoalteromonas phage Pq0]